MSQELLFEIGTEEIPAGYIVPALESLKQNITKRLKELNLEFGQVKGAATPRRLAISVEQLAERQPDTVEELVGPPKKAGFDENNTPTKAAIGFAKSRGAEVEDIQIISTAKGEYLMLVHEQKGKDTKELLAGILPEILAEIPFPKSMRWGSGKFSFARPIQWLLAVFGNTPIEFSIDKVGVCGTTTRGHRFMAADQFPVGNYEEYIAKLRDHHVIADIKERSEAVVREITKTARAANGEVLPDDELVGIVTNLVEKPHAICGSFDPKFLALPQEVLITSMREHQKYFAIIAKDGSLMPNFIAVNNTAIKDKQLGAEGHQRVLRARLEDAMFFFDDDKQKKLADFVPDLKGIVFQAKLGTIFEKTERMVAITAELADQLAPKKLEEAKRTAMLAKADLLSAMVNEFPSLQGIMGKNYALRDGESPAVAKAIHEHYMPVRAGSALPESIIGALVSIADRIDTIAGCFGIGHTPTGAADPFGLRRLTLGLIHIIEDKQFTISLQELGRTALQHLRSKITESEEDTLKNVINFIMGRYVNYQISNGVSPETVEAVTSVKFDDIIDCTLKIKALKAVQQQESFSMLAGTFKRVMNIIKDHKNSAVDQSLLAEEAEKDLYSAYLEVHNSAKPAINNRDYETAMATILQMKEPIDRFFDDVMVMAEDEKLKNNRLALLTAIASLFLEIGDFSKMYAVNN